MTRLRRLAASARPLADVLIDALRASNRLSRLLAPLPPQDDQGRQQLSLQLEEEGDDRRIDDAILVLYPEDVAAAVLVGNAFEHSRDALTHLRDPDMVAVIEVPHPDFVEPVMRLLRKHVFGPETSVLNGDGVDKQPTAAALGTVIVFKRTEETKPKKAWAGGAGIAAGTDSLQPHRNRRRSQPFAPGAHYPRGASHCCGANRRRCHRNRDRGSHRQKPRANR
jgi:hypothetical protein